MTDLETLNVVIAGDSGTALSAVDSLISAIGRLKKSVGGMNGVKQKMQQALGGITGSASGAGKRLSGIFGAAGGSQTRKLTPKYQALQNQFDMLDSSLSKLYTRYDALNDAGVSGQSKEFQQVTRALRDLGVEQDKVLEKMAKLRGAGKQYDEGMESLKKSTDTFGNSMKRMAERMVLRKIINAAISALKKGIDNLYQWDKAVGTGFVKSMDDLKSAATLGTNALATAFAPAIQAMIPIVSALISLIVTLCNVLSMLGSLLGGAGGWRKATKSMTEFSKAAGGGGGALKGLLADWDELNIIQSQGGGGGGGGASAFDDMFDYVLFTDKMLEIQKIIDAIPGPVKAVAAGLAAWGISKLLPTRLRGIFGVIVAIVGAVKLAEETMKQWVDGVSFESMDKMMIATGILAAGLAIKFGTVGLAIGLLVGGVAMAIAPLKELIETGNMCYESFQQLQVAVLLLGAGIALLTGSWIPLVVAALASVALEIAARWDQIKMDFQMLWESITSSVERWWSQVTTIWNEYVNWIDSNIIQPIATFFTNLGTNIQNIWESVVTWVQEKWNTFTEWISSTLITKVTMAFNAGKLKIKEIWGKIVEAVKSVWKDIKTWFDTNVVQPIKDVFTPIVEWIETSIMQPIKDAWASIVGPIQDLINTITAWFNKNESKTVTVNQIVNTTYRTVDASVDEGVVKKFKNGYIPDPLGIFKASGGFVGAGEMFIAREAGPEMVGTIGGHTAVANNDQIVAGIASGVASANTESNALLRQQNALLTQLLNKKLVAEAVPSAAWGQMNSRSAEMWRRNSGRG